MKSSQEINSPAMNFFLGFLQSFLLPFFGLPPLFLFDGEGSAPDVVKKRGFQGRRCDRLLRFFL